jgi:hypothetical protein
MLRPPESGAALVPFDLQISAVECMHVQASHMAADL